MTGSAELARTRADILKQLKKDRKRAAGENRQSFSGVVSADTGNIGISSGGQAIGLSGFLKTEGDTMIGPLAFFPQAATLASDILDISQANTKYSSRVIIAAQIDTAPLDDLGRIDGAAFAGQLLIIQTLAGQTITIKHLSGPSTPNIRTSTAADIVMGPQTDLWLIFDSIATEWTNIGGTASGDNLGNHIATQPLLMSGKEITGFKFLESNTANPADAEELRLAKTDRIAWRNNANTANFTLGNNVPLDFLRLGGAKGFAIDNAPNDVELFFNTGAGKIKYDDSETDLIFNVGPSGKFEFRDNNYNNLIMTIQRISPGIIIETGPGFTVHSNTVVFDGLNFTLDSTTATFTVKSLLTTIKSATTRIGDSILDKVGFFGTSGVVQFGHISDPTGGITVDTECRAALSTLLSQFAGYGLQAAT